MGCELWNKQALKSFLAHRAGPFHEVLHLSLLCHPRAPIRGYSFWIGLKGPVRKDWNHKKGNSIKAKALSSYLPLEIFGICESAMNE